MNQGELKQSTLGSGGWLRPWLAPARWRSMGGVLLQNARRPMLNPQAQAMYRQMIVRLQRDMLLLLMALLVPLSLFFGVQTFYNAWVVHTIPRLAFWIHTTEAVLIVLLAVFFLRRRMVGAAWVAVLCIGLSATVVQMWLLQEPGILLFALLSLAGPAIVMPLRVTVLLVAGLVGALLLSARAMFPASAAAVIGASSLFTTIVLGFACIGIVIRRFVGQFAQTTVEREREAAQRGKLEQQMSDLQRQISRIASLEHDLRQPLRTVQGYLATLAGEEPTANTEALIMPALAAARRADRLINNLLDRARAEAHQHKSIPQSIDADQLLMNIEQSVPGLARYYTDPPTPICFVIERPLPKVKLDREQFERALLNLLDNALMYPPPPQAIEVRAWADATAFRVEVHDHGPGLPDPVRAALTTTGSPDDQLGLGLSQVWRMVQTHAGSLTVNSTEQGTIVHMAFPQQ